MLKTFKGSENYQCIVINLPARRNVSSLDNLVVCTVIGNDCLISKNSKDGKYLFFPAECCISPIFLKANNLYRHNEDNEDTTKKGFFEKNNRVRAIKFKGVISSGFIVELSSLLTLGIDISNLKVGDEFNEIAGIEICRKYVKVIRNATGTKASNEGRVLDSIINSKQAPEHFSTSHLMKNIHKLSLNKYMSIQTKGHGTSCRVFNTETYKKLSISERILKYFGFKIQDTENSYIVGSRHVIKSVNFETLSGKSHFYSEDLWSKVSKQYFDGKLHHGEGIYFEIIGSDYNGKEIQKGYSYGFNKPVVYIYRITNINKQGIEVDLSYHQMIDRAEQLGIPTFPELFYGTLSQFLALHGRYDGPIEDNDDLSNRLQDIFYNDLLDKPDPIDRTVVSEGFCIRIDKYPNPEILKIKSPKFLLHESKMSDAMEENIEDS